MFYWRNWKVSSLLVSTSEHYTCLSSRWRYKLHCSLWPLTLGEGREASHPDCSAHRADDESPSWLLLLLLRWAEGTGELDVPLVQSNLLPLKVRFLIQNPPEGQQPQEHCQLRTPTRNRTDFIPKPDPDPGVGWGLLQEDPLCFDKPKSQWPT